MDDAAAGSMIQYCRIFRLGIPTKKTYFGSWVIFLSKILATLLDREGCCSQSYFIHSALHVSLASQSFMFLLFPMTFRAIVSIAFYFSSFSSILGMTVVGATCPIVLCASRLQDPRCAIKNVRPCQSRYSSCTCPAEVETVPCQELRKNIVYLSVYSIYPCFKLCMSVFVHTVFPLSLWHIFCHLSSMLLRMISLFLSLFCSMSAVQHQLVNEHFR